MAEERPRAVFNELNDYMRALQLDVFNERSIRDQPIER